MKLSEMATKLATAVQDELSKPLQAGQSVTVEPLLTNKAMSAYGRKLEPDCIALRVLIVANADLPAELGQMEIFPPVSKKILRVEPLAVFAAVMRYVNASLVYRADMLGQAAERVLA